jgi:hypothetical protein
MARHDPAAILGFLLIGAFAVLFFRVQSKMQKAGYKTYEVFVSSRKWGLPADYLRIRKQQGWSPWPVYLMWPCLLAGITLLVVGLLRLQDWCPRGAGLRHPFLRQGKPALRSNLPPGLPAVLTRSRHFASLHAGLMTIAPPALEIRPRAGKSAPAGAIDASERPGQARATSKHQKLLLLPDACRERF